MTEGSGIDSGSETVDGQEDVDVMSTTYPVSGPIERTFLAYGRDESMLGQHNAPERSPYREKCIVLLTSCSSHVT